MDGPEWWAYNYPKNLNKQDQAKLIVAQTVPRMRVCADSTADKFLNNVRVNGVFSAPEVDQRFLLGVLNGPVCDFVFRRIGKPKAGGYFEANKQFIAPLPVPDVDLLERRAVAEGAGRLQAGWSRRRDLIVAAADRLSVLSRHRFDECWLWPDLPSHVDFQAQAPRALVMPGERRDWADSRMAEAIAVKVESMQGRLDGAGQLDAEFRDGELLLFVDGGQALRRIYLENDAGVLTQAYWRFLFLSQSWRDAGSLAEQLRRPPSGVGAPAAAQFIAKVDELAAEVMAIERMEAEMNERLFALYDLTIEERLLVEAG